MPSRRVYALAALLAQLPLADLAARSERKACNPEEARRHLEAGDALGTEGRQRGGLYRMLHPYGGRYNLAVVAVGHLQDRDLGYRGMLGEDVLYLDRIDVLATADNHIAQSAAPYYQPTGRPHIAEIAVTHTGPRDHAHEDVYVAIRDAFDAAGRLLEDHARKFRGDVKTHESPLHGKVIRLFPYEGYGFIETSEGQEVYFHKNSVTGPGFDKLEVGTEVRLVVAEAENPHGPQASTVTAIGKHHIVG